MESMYVLEKYLYKTKSVFLKQMLARNPQTLWHIETKYTIILKM